MAAISKEDALKIAREECMRQGWQWNDQTVVKWGLLSFTIWGGGRKGGNLFMKIRRNDGVILKSNISTR